MSFFYLDVANNYFDKLPIFNIQFYFKCFEQIFKHWSIEKILATNFKKNKYLLNYIATKSYFSIHSAEKVFLFIKIYCEPHTFILMVYHRKNLNN